MQFVFKASYDTANRTSLSSFRGPGIEEGLRILQRVKEEVGVRVLRDVHDVHDIDRAAETLDIIQIPAFLSRQTDLLVEAARTGKTINIKKAQFMAPEDLQYAVDKVVRSGNDDILLTERGTMLGYNTLVVDFRSFSILRATGFPVIFDVTHAVQIPSRGGRSSGNRASSPWRAQGPHTASTAYSRKSTPIPTGPSTTAPTRSAWTPSPKCCKACSPSAGACPRTKLSTASVLRYSV